MKAYFRRAQAEAKLGLRARACADLGHVLAVEPVNPEARAVMAELLATAAGDGNKVLDLFKKSVEIVFKIKMSN